MFAYTINCDFAANGIMYKITGTNTVSVTYHYVPDRRTDYNAISDYSGKVVIPESVTFNNKEYEVTGITDFAFRSTKNMVSLTIPNTVQTIGQDFLKDSKLDSLYVLDSKTPINSSIICLSIRYIYLGRNIKNCKCQGVRKVDIGENVTKIPDNFLDRNSVITEISIPNNVDSIGNYAFCDCSKITDLALENIKGYGDFALAGTALSSITFREGTEDLPNGLCSGCQSLSSVALPQSLKTIGNCCFGGCTSLKSIILPQSVSYIGSTCFAGAGILNIELPKTIEILYEGTFSSCQQLEKIQLPSSIKEIGDKCFNNCNSLRSISFPSSVEKIGNEVFNYCNALKSIRFEDSDNDLSIGYGYYYSSGQGWGYYTTTRGPLYTCSIDSIYIGRNIIGWSEGFDIHNKLKLIEIGSLTKEIYSSHLCYDTQKLIVDNAKEKLVAWGNSNLKCDTLYLGRPIDLICKESQIVSATISGYCTNINNEMFRNCALLEQVKLNGTTTSIGDHAFSNCSALNSVTIECNLQTIGVEAFYKCSNLTKIKFPESLESIDNTAFAGTGLIDVVIPNKVKSIGHSAFAGDKSLIHISLGEKLSSIGYWAFHQTSITSVIIPKTVTYIGEGAFAECKKLDKVFMKTSTAEVASNAFEYGGVNYRITYAPNTNYSSLGGIGKTIVSNLAVNIFEDGDYIYLPLSGTKKTCAIVDWKNHAKEKNIVIPSSVKYGKQTLKPVEIGINTFYGCDITSLKLPENITVIDDNACNSCESLKSVILDEALTSIEEQAFYNCTSLDTVYFGKELKTIGASAFYGANRIKHINLQDAVTSIGANAFDGCSDLTTITLGCNVANIKDAAFANCANVTDIISYNPDAPVCVKGVFDSVDKFSCNVYVPKNSVDIYASATEWEDFFNLIEMPYEGGTQTITLNVSKYLWSTLILPFDAEIPAGLKVYDVYDTDETGCVPTEVDKIKANVPYLVKGIMGKYKFSGISKAIEETYSNGLLTGTHASNYEAPIGSYVLQYHIGSGFAFYKVNRDGIMLPANRCYLTKDASAAKFLVPFVTEETTGINDITNDVANTASTIYTLDGKVVNASKQNQNGIFVIDGKKVIIK